MPTHIEGLPAGPCQCQFPFHAQLGRAYCFSLFIAHKFSMFGGTFFQLQFSDSVCFTLFHVIFSTLIREPATPGPQMQVICIQSASSAALHTFRPNKCLFIVKTQGGEGQFLCCILLGAFCHSWNSVCGFNLIKAPPVRGANFAYLF